MKEFGQETGAAPACGVDPYEPVDREHWRVSRRSNGVTTASTAPDDPQKAPARGLTQPEIDIVTKPMCLADRLSGLNLPSRLHQDARRRRADRRWQAPAQVSRLEERCMLSGIVMPATRGMTPDMVISQVNATMTTI